MKRKLFLILTLIIVIITTAYIFYKNIEKSSSVDIDNYKYIYLHSHPLEGETTLSFTNDGEKFERINYNLTDIPNLSINNKNEIILMAEHYSEYYQIDEGNELNKNPIPGPLILFIDNEEIALKLYNIDINDNELEVIDHKNNKEYTVTLPAYSVSGTYDEQNIYVITATIEDQYLLHIVDRTLGNIKSTIELDSYPFDVIEYKGKLVIPTFNHFFVVDKNNLNIKKYDFNAINDIYIPMDIVTNDEELYLIYIDNIGMSNIIKYNDLFERVAEYNLEFPYTTSYVKDMQLYILYQDENSDVYGGKMGAFDILTGKKLEEFNVPKEGNKVQNLLVR